MFRSNYRFFSSKICIIKGSSQLINRYANLDCSRPVKIVEVVKEGDNSQNLTAKYLSERYEEVRENKKVTFYNESIYNRLLSQLKEVQVKTSDFLIKTISSHYINVAPEIKKYNLNISQFDHIGRIVSGSEYTVNRGDQKYHVKITYDEDVTKPNKYTYWKERENIPKFSDLQNDEFDINEEIHRIVPTSIFNIRLYCAKIGYTDEELSGSKCKVHYILKMDTEE